MAPEYVDASKFQEPQPVRTPLGLNTANKSGKELSNEERRKLVVEKNRIFSEDAMRDYYRTSKQVSLSIW